MTGKEVADQYTPEQKQLTDELYEGPFYKSPSEIERRKGLTEWVNSPEEIERRKGLTSFYKSPSEIERRKGLTEWVREFRKKK